MESTNSQAPDRNLALDLVRVTEAAAMAAARWMGRGDKNAADGAAVDAMRIVLSTVPMQGVIVIGEFPPNAITAAATTWTLGSRAAHLLALMGGVYIVVRGLDNIDHGLPLRWRWAWRHVFGVTPADRG